MTILFSVVAAPVYIATSSAQVFPFLYILTSICYLLPFDNHSNRHVMISNCDLDLHFLNNYIEQLFIWLLAYQKITNKQQKQMMAKKSRLGVPKGERRGSGMDGYLGGFLDANSYIWNGWATGP